MASERVRVVRRIGCPFSPGCRAIPAVFGMFPETFPEPLPRASRRKSSVISRKLREILAIGVPERSGTCFNSPRWLRPRPPASPSAQIADLAGVSIATVSRVLNGRGDVSDETRELVSRVDPRERLHGEPKRPGPVGRPHRPGRRPRPARLPRVLLGDPRRRSRGAVRAATCRSSSRRPATSTTARSRVLDRLHGLTRRRADHPARGVERGARAAARRRLPLRRRRSADAARRAHPVGLGRTHVGRRPGDAPPARARAPADRADHRPARLGRDRGSSPRLPRGARVGGHPARPALEVARRSRDRSGARGRRPPARPSRAADGDLRVQRQHRDRRDRRRRAHVGCACRRTSRSSASTTSSTRRS